MAEKENAERENDLREKALEAQRSVGVVTEVVDAVHRHSLAAKASKAALTTEVNELKNKNKSFAKCAKALVKSQKKGKTGTLGGIAKEITGNLFHKNDQEALGKGGETNAQPSAPTKDKISEPPPSYVPTVEANVTEIELVNGKDRWRASLEEATAEKERLRRAQDRLAKEEEEEARQIGAEIVKELEERVARAREAVVRAQKEYYELKETYKTERTHSPQARHGDGNDPRQELSSTMGQEDTPRETGIRPGHRRVEIITCERERGDPLNWTVSPPRKRLYPRLSASEGEETDDESRTQAEPNDRNL